MSRTITIDFTKTPADITSDYAGEMKEAQAVSLKIIPEAEMTSDTTLTTYYVNFQVTGGILPSAFFNAGDEIIVPLNSTITSEDFVVGQLVAQNSAGTTVYRTPIFELRLGESVEGTIVPSPSGQTIYTQLANAIAACEAVTDSFPIPESTDVGKVLIATDEGEAGWSSSVKDTFIVTLAEEDDGSYTYTPTFAEVQSAVASKEILLKMFDSVSSVNLYDETTTQLRFSMISDDSTSAFGLNSDQTVTLISEDNIFTYGSPTTNNIIQVNSDHKPVFVTPSATPTANSSVPITSGAVYTAVSDLTDEIDSKQDEITSTNKLSYSLISDTPDLTVKDDTDTQKISTFFSNHSAFNNTYMTILKNNAPASGTAIYTYVNAVNSYIASSEDANAKTVPYDTGVFGIIIAHSSTYYDVYIPAWGKFAKHTLADNVWNVVYRTDTALADLTDDATHRIVTDTEKATWNAKQNTLTAGTGIAISNDTISTTIETSTVILNSDATTSLYTAEEIWQGITAGKIYIFVDGIEPYVLNFSNRTTSASTTTYIYLSYYKGNVAQGNAGQVHYIQVNSSKVIADYTTMFSKTHRYYTNTDEATLTGKIDKPSTATDGQVLTWNDTSEEWEAQTPKADAQDVYYDNTQTGYQVTNVQDAIDTNSSLLSQKANYSDCNQTVSSSNKIATMADITASITSVLTTSSFPTGGDS